MAGFSFFLGLPAAAGFSSTSAAFVAGTDSVARPALGALAIGSGFPAETDLSDVLGVREAAPDRMTFSVPALFVAALGSAFAAFGPPVLRVVVVFEAAGRDRATVALRVTFFLVIGDAFGEAGRMQSPARTHVALDALGAVRLWYGSPCHRSIRLLALT